MKKLLGLALVLVAGYLVLGVGADDGARVTVSNEGAELGSSSYDILNLIDASGNVTAPVSTSTLAASGAATLSSTLSVASDTTVTAGDLILSDGRLVTGVESTPNNCSSNAVTIDLSADEKGVVVADQASAATCAVTLSNGTAGELVVLDLIYGGDVAWTLAAGGQYIGDTFDESTCNDFQATAADGDHLVVAGIMADADTIIPFSCQYLDQ